MKLLKTLHEGLTGRELNATIAETRVTLADVNAALARVGASTAINS